MGIDIHLVLQVKKEDKWITIGNPMLYRNRELFYFLCGVDNLGQFDDSEIMPKSKPRGFPEDFEINKDGNHPFVISHNDFDNNDFSLSKFVHMGDHDASWLNLSEFTLNDIFSYNSISNLVGEFVKAGFNLEDVRMVFNFDS